MSQVARVAKQIALVVPVCLMANAFCPNPVFAQNRLVTRQASAQTDASKLYKKVLPSVVTVSGLNGHGSGFIVSSDGLIVTNAHVTENEPKVVTVKFADGSTAPADVIGFSPNREDLCLLKVNMGKKLPALPLAPTSSVKVGDRVFAVGTPLDEENANTFTQGNVIRINKKTNQIVHTALINGGNSGGPLVDLAGRVIGVNTSVALKGENVQGADGRVIGFTYRRVGDANAINIREVKTFLSEYKQGKISTRPTYEDPSPQQAASAEGRKIKSISTNGQLVSGKLEEGDNQLNDGSYLDLYSFSAKAGQTVTIELNSKDFDPTLLLFGIQPDGKLTKDPVAQNDDRGPGNQNSRVSVTIPSDGSYIVFVNGKARGEMGNYQLSVSMR